VTYINLKNNQLGAVGAAAVVAGLGTAPLKTLDLTRNGLGVGLYQVAQLAIEHGFDLHLSSNQDGAVQFTLRSAA
jgi:hypothetical protein